MRYHKTIGPVTIYPRDSAMRGAIEINIAGGWLCLRPPARGRGWYVYFSTDATPSEAKWHFGPGWLELRRE